MIKVIPSYDPQIVVDNTLNAAVGEQVVVAIEESALVQGSFVVYMLPLLMMLMMGILAEILFASELITILLALVGLFLSMIFVRYVLSVSGLKKSIQPHLIRRIS